jgi:hypothetical protein
VTSLLCDTVRATSLPSLVAAATRQSRPRLQRKRVNRVGACDRSSSVEPLKTCMIEVPYQSIAFTPGPPLAVLFWEEWM